MATVLRIRDRGQPLSFARTLRSRSVSLHRPHPLRAGDYYGPTHEHPRNHLALARRAARPTPSPRPGRLPPGGRRGPAALHHLLGGLRDLEGHVSASRHRLLTRPPWPGGRGGGPSEKKPSRPRARSLAGPACWAASHRAGAHCAGGGEAGRIGGRAGGAVEGRHRQVPRRDRAGRRAAHPHRRMLAYAREVGSLGGGVLALQGPTLLSGGGAVSRRARRSTKVSEPPLVRTRTSADAGTHEKTIHAT